MGSTLLEEVSYASSCQRYSALSILALAQTLWAGVDHPILNPTSINTISHGQDWTPAIAGDNACLL